MVKAQVAGADGKLSSREITLDTAETAGALQLLFSREQVVTIHSEEASLDTTLLCMPNTSLSSPMVYSV